MTKLTKQMEEDVEKEFIAFLNRIETITKFGVNSITFDAEKNGTNMHLVLGPRTDPRSWKTKAEEEAEKAAKEQHVQSNRVFEDIEKLLNKHFKSHSCPFCD